MLTTKRITAKLKSSDSTKVNVNDNDSYLGAGALQGDNRHGARTIGIPGADGQPGEKGDKGDPGIVWMGEFNSATLYTYSNAVSFGGNSYIYVNTTDTIGNMPPNPTYWEILAAAGTTGDKSHIHNQSVSSDVWSITHNLGKFPVVTVIDSAGTQVEGEINYVDSNSLIINFSAEFGGRAYLN